MGFWVVLFGGLVWLFLVGCGCCLLYLRGIKTLNQTQYRLRKTSEEWVAQFGTYWVCILNTEVPPTSASPVCL